MQGRHGWQGPQGLGLAWILKNRKRQWQRRRWPCLPKIGRGGPEFNTLKAGVSEDILNSLSHSLSLSAEL